MYGGVARFAAEAPWSKRLALRLLRRVAAESETDAFGRDPLLEDVPGCAPALFVCADPEALVPALAQRRLLERLGEGRFDVVSAVANEAKEPELRRAPPFAYATPSALDEVAELVARHAPGPIVVTRSLPVFAVRRELLRGLPSQTPLAGLPEALSRRGARLVADPGAYFHRYGEMDASERSDLVAKIPPGARRVLDVGCAQGATAGALREMGVEEIFGIEPDAGDAALAAKRCDRVEARALADVSESWDGYFDAILFGDVLEHLDDPSSALRKVRSWLSKSGRVIASVPNLATAAVIGDLLQGRFDYVPYSVLSGTHLRAFTRGTLAGLFESCGYSVAEISATVPEPTPAVRELIEKLRRLPGASPDLAATELTIVGYDPKP